MKAKTAAYAVGGTGIVLVALAVSSGWVLAPMVIEYKIAEKIAIRNNTESFNRWKRLPMPLDFRVHLFEVVNSKEVTLNGAKPAVKERGPYVYKKSVMKKNIAMFEEEDRAVYDQHFLYEFSREESVGDENEEIEMLNVPALLFAQVAESITGLKISLEVLNEVIQKMWPEDQTFVKTTVRNYLFGGVKMNCNPDADPSLDKDVVLKFKWKLLCLAYAKLHPQTITIDDGEEGTNSFAFFKYKNFSADGPYEVNLGIKEPKNLGKILKWREERTLGSTWGGKTCNAILGTDTTIYRPYLHDVNVLQVFHSDVHRSINLTYDGDVMYKGVQGRRYIIDETVFASVRTNENNYCFCPRSVKNLTSYGGCLKSGLLELSSSQGAPAVLSHPHLLMADRLYRSMIDGLNPEKEKHQTFVDLEPNTGIPLRGAIRMQMNLLMKKIPEIDVMKNYPDKIVPVLWFEEAMELSDELVDEIKGQLLHLLSVVNVTRWTVLTVGLLTSLASAAYLVGAAVSRRGSDAERRKNLGSRGRTSNNYSEGDAARERDGDNGSKEFDETANSVGRHTSSGGMPQIYDPLKSCFEVLKPFHISDLDTGNNFEQLSLGFPKKLLQCRGDETEKKSKKLFIPPLNLSQRNGSEGTNSDTDCTLPNLSTSSPKCRSKGNGKSSAAHGDREKAFGDDQGKLEDTFFDYKFLSSDEKSRSDDEPECDASQKSESDRKSDEARNALCSPASAASHQERDNSSAGVPSSRSKKSKNSLSSDQMCDTIDSGRSGRMTDTQVTQELKLADERATRTVKMIEQIREAISAYQEKDTMTEEENRELKRHQQKLSKNLQQLEKITSRVKQLVGLADKSFKKKCDELAKSDLSHVEEDLKAGGDTAKNVDQSSDKSERKPVLRCREIRPQEISKTAKQETESEQLDETNEDLRKASTPRSSESTQSTEKNEDRSDLTQQSAKTAVTPRTRLKNDLKKLADELNADFDNSETETTDEPESPALSKHGSTTEPDVPKFEAKSPGNGPLTRLLLPSESLETKMSKFIASDSKPLAKVQSISALDSFSRFKTSSLPSVDSDTRSVPEVMLSLTGRLSESYSMQEKLAAENADLEGLRYQLQEELITKENAVELLQRKVANLQAEMRLMARENAQLNDRLLSQGMNPPCEDKISVKVAPPTQDDIVDMKLEEYKETTQTLESTVCTLETEVKRIQQELQIVQKERQELENHRKMMKININVQRRGMGTHGGLLSPLPPRDSNTELQVRELKEQYDRLQQDFNNKMLEVASLRAQNDKLMEITDKAREEKDYCEERCKSLEKSLKQLEGEKTKMLGSKEQLFEQEQQMSVMKARFREAQDEIDELRNQLDDQTAQLDDYRNKYLQAQQQVEEQIRQIDHMELENQRAREEQNSEIQRLKQCFQEKLSELTPLADILKDTQMKLQEAQQLRMIAERNLEDLQRELQESKERSNSLLRKIESERNSQQLGLDERSQMTSRLESWEKKCSELRDENAKLRATVVRLEEACAQNEKRLDEKLHEVAQFSNQLETLREESARQVARCKDRNETIKRSLQNQIADLERQLAQARAAARTAQKDKDEIRQRMQTHINNLNDNFEQAQLRIKSLQSHVNFLKNSYSGMFTPEPSNVSLVDCTSGYLIEPPCNPCDCTY